MMGKAAKIQKYLTKLDANEALIDLIPALEELLPMGVGFDMVQWDLLPWKTRKGSAKSYIIKFEKIKNRGLRTLIKIYFLEKRQRKSISSSTIRAELNSLFFLDRALGSMGLNSISNATFENAQDLIVANIKASAAPRNVDCLIVFGRWLTVNLGFRISFCNTLQTIYIHGRKASDKDRDNKLIDSRIIIDLIACLPSSRRTE
jgi:hypothetical protein